MNETVLSQLIILAILLVAGFWLIVVPYRLCKGLIHKWGYHAYCGNSCEINQNAARIEAALNERFRDGMRQGMRGATAFGEKRSREILDDTSLLPKWDPPKDDGFAQGVKAKYDDIRLVLDVNDDRQAALTAIAVALGIGLKTTEDVRAAYESAMRIAADFANLPLIET